MTENNPGFCWHVHHEKLCDWCYDYKGRKRYIETKKPESERELRLFRPIRSALPKSLLKAWADWSKVRDDYNKASADYYKAWADCWPEIEALHAAECPNCPWDGTTIFPVKVAAAAGGE